MRKDDNKDKPSLLLQALALQSKIETLTEHQLESGVRERDETYTYMMVVPEHAASVTMMSNWLKFGWRIHEDHPMQEMPNIIMSMPNEEFDRKMRSSTAYYKSLESTSFGKDVKQLGEDHPEIPDVIHGRIEEANSMTLGEFGAHMPVEGDGILTPGWEGPGPVDE